jgi:predicted kinase
MTEEQPNLLLLIGIPGSGKSSWLAGLDQKHQDNGHYVLVDGIPYTIVCPDAIRQSFSNISDQSQNIIVWQVAKSLTYDRLERGVNVILDATNVNTSRRREFLQGLPPCQKIVKLFSTHPEEAYRRIKKDLDGNKQRSKVPEEAVYKMYGELLYTLKVIGSEGFEFLSHSGKIIEKPSFFDKRGPI